MANSSCSENQSTAKFDQFLKLSPKSSASVRFYNLLEFLTLARRPGVSGTNAVVKSARGWYPRTPVAVGPTLACETQNKKADVAEHPEEFRHVGLLFNESPGIDRVTLYLVVRQLCNSRVMLRRRLANCNGQIDAPAHLMYRGRDFWAGMTVISSINIQGEHSSEKVGLLTHINNPSRQRRALQEKLTLMLGYLNKLRRWMQHTGFAHDDPLWDLVRRALKSMQVLVTELRCGAAEKPR